ncbi:hypothetical protein HYDPIDRAFT_112726 [Hydnomerulius pinastri MD-312]|uniref:G domain-containing protein n=1 Tax=Hydnomerulius pinastri MD-312 TaxID=994086 RepID=A0A0C9VZC3_9AGAM|nr:hypothetical protein HYDPIDRAFT_112726 [Hydnomerulius pinastri MD-312]
MHRLFQIGRKYDFRSKSNGPRSNSASPLLESSTPRTKNNRVEKVQEPVVTSDDLVTDDIIIAVIGPTGSGKSSFIRKVAEIQEEDGGHVWESCTSEVKATSFMDKRSGLDMVLVDTPGFDDTTKTESDILKMISEWLNASYKKQVLLAGILYFHRISDDRTPRMSSKNLRGFKQLCGETAPERTVLTTTMWDEVEESTGIERLKELESSHWKGMITKGSKTFPYKNTAESAQDLIQLVIANAEKRRGKGQEPAVSVTLDDLATDDIIVAVMGPTGSGKSSFISKVTGIRDDGVGHTLKSFTSEVKATKIIDKRSGLDIVLVDTPGFDDTNKTDLEILNMISDWLNASYKKHVLLAGIFYFHRISDNRMAGTPLKNLRVFKQLCGEMALEQIVLTTTMWDEVEESTGTERLKELESNYWKGMIIGGSRTFPYKNTTKSAQDLIQLVIANAEKKRQVQLQQEMSDLGRELRETGAGQELFSRMELLAERQLLLLRKINAEKKRAKDQGTLVDLQREYDELRTSMAQTLREMHTLKLPLKRRIIRFFAQSKTDDLPK